MDQVGEQRTNKVQIKVIAVLIIFFILLTTTVLFYFTKLRKDKLKAISSDIPEVMSFVEKESIGEFNRIKITGRVYKSPYKYQDHLAIDMVPEKSDNEQIITVILGDETMQVGFNTIKSSGREEGIVMKISELNDYLKKGRLISAWVNFDFPKNFIKLKRSKETCNAQCQAQWQLVESLKEKNVKFIDSIDKGIEGKNLVGPLSQLSFYE